jgi:hypothetical protein
MRSFAASIGTLTVLCNDACQPLSPRRLTLYRSTAGFACKPSRSVRLTSLQANLPCIACVDRTTGEAPIRTPLLPCKPSLGIAASRRNRRISGTIWSRQVPLCDRCCSCADLSEASRHQQSAVSAVVLDVANDGCLAFGLFSALGCQFS